MSAGSAIRTLLPLGSLLLSGPTAAAEDGTAAAPSSAVTIRTVVAAPVETIGTGGNVSFKVIMAAPADIPPAANARPDAPDAPLPGDLERRLDALELQNRLLKHRLDALNDRVSDIEDRTSHDTLGFGLTTAWPLRGRAPKFGAEANWRYVYGCYFLPIGGGVGLNATLQAWRLKVHWLGLGAFFNQNGRAMSVTDIQRRWDLMLTSGLDLRLWQGLEIRGQAAWFLPEPGAVYDLARKRLEKGIDALSPADPGGTLDKKAPKESFDIFIDAYRRALRSPYLGLGIRWEF